ncbi:hypothetical protein C1645_765315 [Glomus cerebriforme]|uniref:Uncharacterized protein n=1 Tax=Glomus cerebriforme TaxID=658196 RepID=A0A397T230_9GLOM|nr:hypothetical protein C1645_765315 [Glomus cerebriforme]
MQWMCNKGHKWFVHFNRFFLTYCILFLSPLHYRTLIFSPIDSSLRMIKNFTLLEFNKLIFFLIHQSI